MEQNMIQTLDLLRREIKALTFDQYGTIVDMQQGLTEAVTPFLKRKGWDGEPNNFVTWWRRTQLRTCWRRIERNLPIIVYASVSNFSHSYASHSLTLSRLAGLVEDEHLKLVGSLAFLCHVLALAPMRLRQ
jgi:hypothetical protein